MSMEHETLLDLQFIVLGSCIRYPEALGRALTTLTAEDFTTVGTQGLWEGILRLHAQGAPINSYSLAAELGSDYAPLAERAQLAPTRDCGYYIDKLREVARLTAMQAEAVHLQDADTPEAAAKALERLNHIAVSRGGVEIVELGGAIRDFCENFEKIYPPPISSGIHFFDRQVFLRPGKLFILGGYPSSGKTMLALQMALSISRTKKVGIFSCETDAGDIAARVLSTMTGIFYRKLQLGDLNDADRAAVEHAGKMAGELKLEIIQSSGMTADDIAAITAARGLEVVIVDYIQLVEGGGPKASGYERVSYVSRTLQGLSRRQRVLVIALSQLSRPETSKDGKVLPPNMSSLRESGQLEQDADVIALLYPEDMADNRSDRILKVAKNKDGERTALRMRFDGARQRMECLGVVEPRRARQPAAVDNSWRRAGDGSGYVRIPEGDGPAPPQEFAQQRLTV